MVVLEVWFDQRPENDLGPGDPPIIVAGASDVDALIARVLDATAGWAVPAVVQAQPAGGQGFPVIEAGIGTDKGFISYLDRTGSYQSCGDFNCEGQVTYDYMGNSHTMPASSEIPLPDVRRWLADFVATGEPSPAVPLRSTV